MAIIFSPSDKLFVGAIKSVGRLYAAIPATAFGNELDRKLWQVVAHFGERLCGRASRFPARNRRQRSRFNWTQPSQMVHDDSKPSTAGASMI